MRFTAETTSDGVCERSFILDDISGALDDITGVLWLPAAAPGPTDASPGRPLVLIGHGGGQHKKAPGVVARAHRYVTASGFAAAAIDAPGHGERPKSESDQRSIATIRERMAAGESVISQVASYNADLALRAIPEWQATLDALTSAGYLGATAPVGYLGLSMGATLGIPFVAAEPRITAAVLGLAGLTGQDTLAEAAALITIPVEFLLQWDDEMIPRDRGLALFDTFASREKTLHANAGGHGDVPRFEVESSQRFFARHLVS
jgi:dienelactone hydrolase